MIRRIICFGNNATYLPTKTQNRWKSVKSKIPTATWSVAELSLTNSDNSESIISDEELQKLSKRCLIDTATMDDDERNKLKFELGNMMRCISLVSSYEPDEPEIMNQEEFEEIMYDVPRGFSSTRFCL